MWNRVCVLCIVVIFLGAFSQEALSKCEKIPQSYYKITIDGKFRDWTSKNSICIQDLDYKENPKDSAHDYKNAGLDLTQDIAQTCISSDASSVYFRFDLQPENKFDLESEGQHFILGERLRRRPQITTYQIYIGLYKKGFEGFDIDGDLSADHYLAQGLPFDFLIEPTFSFDWSLKGSSSGMALFKHQPSATPSSYAWYRWDSHLNYAFGKAKNPQGKTTEAFEVRLSRRYFCPSHKNDCNRLYFMAATSEYSDRFGDDLTTTKDICF